MAATPTAPFDQPATTPAAAPRQAGAHRLPDRPPLPRRRRPQPQHQPDPPRARLGEGDRPKDGGGPGVKPATPDPLLPHPGLDPGSNFFLHHYEQWSA